MEVITREGFERSGGLEAINEHGRQRGKRHFINGRCEGHLEGT
jgi:hypothetical protein